MNEKRTRAAKIKALQDELNELKSGKLVNPVIDLPYTPGKIGRLIPFPDHSEVVQILGPEEMLVNLVFFVDVIVGQPTVSGEPPPTETRKYLRLILCEASQLNRLQTDRRSACPY